MSIKLKTHVIMAPAKLILATDKAARNVLTRFGAYVRKAAQWSLKIGRQKTLDEMSEVERLVYNIRASIAKRTGKPKPKRPTIVSKPGEVPKLHGKSTSKNPLRNLIRFDYLPESRSVVIGAMKFGEAIAGELEHGGKNEPRPFMAPALIAQLPKLEGMFLNSVR